MEANEQAQQQLSVKDWSVSPPATSPDLPSNIQTLWNQDRLTPGLRHAVYVKQLRRRWLFRGFPLTAN